MATIEDILLPDIGDFSNVEVLEILVEPGSRVQAEQSLLTLESDKASIEIPAPKSGIVREVLIQIGDRISQGSRLMTLEVDAGQTALSVVNAQLSGTDSKPLEPCSLPPAERSETTSVVLPDIGDFSDIPVIEILIAPGDRIVRDQSLLTLESDKTTMEIPSPQAGIVEEVVVNIGDKLNPGDLILTLRSALVADAPTQTVTESVPPVTRQTEAPRAHGEAEYRQAPILPRPEDLAAIAVGRTSHASPTVRRFARELGVDLRQVKGLGPKSRILKADVQGFVKQTLARTADSTAVDSPAQPNVAQPLLAPQPTPDVDYSRFGEIDITELPRIKKISGRHLHRCWLTVPHVTQFDEADITELESFRKHQQENARDDGIKLTFLPFLLKAVAAALQQMPVLKSSLTADGERLVIKQYTHIGVAVATAQGLVVPVVRDVDKKGINTLAQELAELSAKARDGKLLPGDLQGGCFSISSLGGIGGTAFTPIVNAPEVAILGVSRSTLKPAWNGAEFVPRLMLPLALSYDHRVVDGADGAQFTTLLGQLLGDIRRLLL